MRLSRPLLASIVLLAACQPSTSINGNSVASVPETEQDSTATLKTAAEGTLPMLLQAGSAKVCNDPTVKQAILAQLNINTNPSIAYEDQDGEAAFRSLQPYLSTITMAGADRQISSVSCDANLDFRGRMPDNMAHTFSINYDVRPSLDQPGGFVTHSNIGQFSDRATSLYVVIAQRRYQQRLAEEQSPTPAQAPPAPLTPEPSSDRPDGNAY